MRAYLPAVAADLRIEAERIIDLGGDRVPGAFAAHCPWQAERGADRHEVGGDLFTLRDGKIVRLRPASASRAVAREAVGLSE